MWLASHWTVRHGGGWRDGEDWLFSRLIDGSRAANRLGWQWSVGAASSKPYVFTRSQVMRRAPGLCSSCALRRQCPIEGPPDGSYPESHRLPAPSAEVVIERMRTGADGDVVAGPPHPTGMDEAVDTVWLTAESLGDSDPASSAHQDVPVVFVFDEQLLGRLRLTGMRVAFIVETLAELATGRDVEVWRGDPGDVLADRRVAVTYAPVPGWRRHAGTVRPVQVHPWPWLVRPAGAPLQSFSAWSRRAGTPLNLLQRR